MRGINFETKADIGKIVKPLILVEKDENGNFREITEIRIETREEVENLKDSVEARKIEITALLPKMFRDAVNVEILTDGIAVFTVPESVARKFSLVA